MIQHHYDDAWFHQTRAFAELSLQLTSDLRHLLPDDHGFRPSFLGHILVEILLDAALIEKDPARLDAYYQAMNQLEPVAAATAIDRMTNGHATNLAKMITMFCRERFLYDYLDDQRLAVRLNRVMRRVNLPELPPSLTDFLAAARSPIRQRQGELLHNPQQHASSKHEPKEPDSKENLS